MTYAHTYMFAFITLSRRARRGRSASPKTKKPCASVHVLLVKLQRFKFLESVEHILQLIVGAHNNGFKCFYPYVFTVVSFR